MGQSISSAVESIQNNAEKEKLANDAMNSLIELAKMQCEAFELAIRGQNDTQLIPIDKILEKDNIIQCNISNSPAEIGKMIEETFSSFITGDVLGGVSKLVSNGLKLLLGSYSGNSSSRDSYAITCGQLGGISRIDMHFYSYRYTSSQLTEVAKQVLCVSIVRSSVDPTKLSDATLRNIVQNTYSASSKEDQKMMYDQLRAARDADLQSRSGNSSSLVAQSMLSSTARANQFTHPSFLAASPTTNGVKAMVGKEVKYTTFEHFYEARLQINTAAANIDSLKNWIYGYLYSDFEKLTVDNGLVVVATVDPASMSNSVIQGHVSIVLSNEVADGQKEVHQQLSDALQGAKSNKCPIPVLSFALSGTSPDDHGGSDHGGGNDAEWPKIGEYGVELWPADHFSDIGDPDDVDASKERWNEELDGKVESGEMSVQNIRQDTFYPAEYLEEAYKKAKELKLRVEAQVDEEVTEWPYKVNIYLTPTTFRQEVPKQVRDLFEPLGTHVHIVLLGSTTKGWAVESVCLTLRHPADIGVVDGIHPRSGRPQFRWHPHMQSLGGKYKLGFEGIMDDAENRLGDTADWWMDHKRYGQSWRKIAGGEGVEMVGAFKALYYALESLTTRADRVLFALTGGDWLNERN